MRAFNKAAVLGLALGVAGCSPPQPANPALWEIDGPHGQRGWLFGTIHALPRPLAWKTAKVAASLDSADAVVLEVARIQDDAGIHAHFESLAHTPGLPPLSQRVSPSVRPALAQLLAAHGLKDDGFGDTETWAAALTLAQFEEKDSDSGNGIDRALADFGAETAKPLRELEGAETQLRLFDALSPRDQQALLEAVVAGSSEEGPDLAEAWAEGDMAVIEKETRTGLLADPGLRAALYTNRNRAWATKVEAMLKAGEHPFVAVGAAHLAGPEGLPALLAKDGWMVKRVE